MPRRRKQDIKINDSDSLTGLIQETYNDACAQINDAQRTINEMSTGAAPTDVDDLTKLAKGKTDALKIKDSAIKIKLEIAKLQNEIIKHKGDVDKAITSASEGKASLSDFKSIREFIKNGEGLNLEEDDNNK